MTDFLNSMLVQQVVKTANNLLGIFAGELQFRNGEVLLKLYRGYEYHCKRSTADAISMALHLLLDYLDNRAYKSD